MTRDIGPYHGAGSETLDIGPLQLAPAAGDVTGAGDGTMAGGSGAGALLAHAATPRLEGDFLADGVALAALHSGEDITYLAGGEAPGTTMRAIVRRHPREAQGGDRRDYRRGRAEIVLTRRASDGVTAVQAGKDQVLMPEFPTSPEDVTWRVVRLLAHDLGSWRLELTR